MYICSIIQVFTTTYSTGVSVKEIEFPSITFCSQGNNQLISNASLTKMFHDFLQNKFGIKIDVSPQKISKIQNAVNLVLCVLNITIIFVQIILLIFVRYKMDCVLVIVIIIKAYCFQDIAELSVADQKLLNYYQLLLNKSKDFLNSDFPNSNNIKGIETVVEIFSSKKPDETITLKSAYSNSPEFSQQHFNYSHYKNFSLRVDVITDLNNCFMYLHGAADKKSLANFNDSLNFCTSRQGPGLASNMRFSNDSHISTFLRLFKSSNYIERLRYLHIAM